MRRCILVNGADNFIGQRVLAALASEPDVTAVSIPTGHSRLLSQHLAGAVGIVHCPLTRLQTEAAALYHALERGHHTPRVVHLSSMTVYGSITGLVNEAAKPMADLGEYSRSHLNAERTSERYRNVVLLRPGAEFGPGCPAWSERVARWLLAHRLGDLGPSGDGVANLVYIEDLVSVIRATLEMGGIEGQIFNVASAEKPTWNEYFTAFAELLRAVPVRRISRAHLAIETRVLAPPLKLAELAAGSLGLRRLQLPPAIPPSLLRLCRQEIILDVSRAERRLGMHWTSLQDGLKQAAQSYRIFDTRSLK
jgi:2-alkyl-3-oxoalkanoate reductase